jgi:hypothetical protein
MSEGMPGRPGEQGTAGGVGGRGGDGGAGGQGKDGCRGVRGHRGRSQYLPYVCAVAVAFFSWGASSHAVDKIDRQADRTAFEALRNCIRANVNAAVIKASFTTDQAAPVAKALYPIVDCKQAVLTGTTIELSPTETRKYVALVVKGRAPIINLGHVVGSRPSILAGLNSVDQAGKP